MNVQLPAQVRQEIQKLPSAAQDVVAQRLRNAPSPPIIYEQAVAALAEIRDLDMTKRAYIAADGLALWGKLHEDNRAIMEAQKLKAHALRQMFICAKMLGEPYQVLQEKKVYHSKAQRAEQLASFEEAHQIDAVAEDIGLQGRPEFLVGRIAHESPLGQEAQRQAQRLREENDRRWREQQRRQQEREAAEAKKEAEAAADPKRQFRTNVLERLLNVLVEVRAVEQFSLTTATPANKKQIRDLVNQILEVLDRLDVACKPRPPGRPRKN